MGTCTQFQSGIEGSDGNINTTHNPDLQDRYINFNRTSAEFLQLRAIQIRKLIKFVLIYFYFKNCHKFLALENHQVSNIHSPDLCHSKKAIPAECIPVVHRHCFQELLRRSSLKTYDRTCWTYNLCRSIWIYKTQITGIDPYVNQ